VDSCNPATGCVNNAAAANGFACGSPSDTGCDNPDSCLGGACQPNYEPSGFGCSDGNACTTADACNGAGVCVGGPAPHCDDGNACNGVETCSPASGCVAGTPVTCAPPDQCHTGGTCDPGTGLCGYANKPDGTPCDDGIASTSGETCQGGVCTGSSCTSSNDPKTKGWYHSLCTSGGHSGDSITDADAACVGALTSTFAGFTTAAQVCDVLDPSHGNNGTCSRAEDYLVSLALNICKHRVCPSQSVDSDCGTSATVGSSLAQADALLANPSRTNAQCTAAECLAKEIDNAHALEFDTLTSVLDSGSIRLNWDAPYTDDGRTHPKSYKIYRRAIGSLAPFVQIGSTNDTTYLDLTSGTGSWEYDVTAVF
jgi:hypothetical protein